MESSSNRNSGTDAREKENDDSPHLDRDPHHSLLHVGWLVALGVAAFKNSDRASEPIKCFCRAGCQGRSSLSGWTLRGMPYQASVVRHADQRLSSALRARLTFSRMSDA